VVFCLAVAGPGRADDVSVEGNRFYRDGVPWVAEGVTLVGRISPAGRVAGKPTYAAARAEFGSDMLDEIRRFGADLVRFQVSQAALDPKSEGYDPDYRDEVLAAVAETRGAGYNVLISMQWHGQAGPSDSKGLPTAGTRRAWRTLAEDLGNDRGILFEIFNEPPGNPRTPAEWVPWQKSMQATVNALRRAGAQNVLLVPGMQYSRYLEGAPSIDDPLDQLGYAVHPYLGRHEQTRAQWEKKWGDFALTHPVMATEWNAESGGSYCRPEMPAQAEALLDYLAEQRIGLVAWALDMRNLREEDGSYTTLDDLVCGERRDGGRGGAGQLIHEHFLAN